MVTFIIRKSTVTNQSQSCAIATALTLSSRPSANPLTHKMMTDQEITDEIQKCRDNPVYFYNNHWTDKFGNKPSQITQAQWDYMNSKEFRIKITLKLRNP